MLQDLFAIVITGNWAKEHQVKVYAEYFKTIGFTIGFKNEILDELARANIIKFGFKKPSFCAL